MANEVKLPRLGQGMESGTVRKWLKAEGDEVAKGEPLFEIDTDKVTQEVESDFAGVLLRIALAEGEAPVGQTIAWIGEQGEPIPEKQVGEQGEDVPEKEDVSDKQVGEPTAEPAPRAEPVSDTTAGAPQQATSNGGRIKASPLARRLARERGIELRSLSGTGPEGRIIAEDVERAATAPPAAAPSLGQPSGEVERIPLTSVRKTIARRLTAAWQAPVFQLTVSADMTRANELVARVRELDPDVRVTITDLLAKLAAVALERHPDVNVQYADDALLRYPTANVGIAVAAPQGLVVPVLRSVERLSLAQVAAARGDVVARARDNKLQAQDLEEGTFTISNLGMFGVEQFVAVLNPPQAAILAVGAAIDTPVVEDGAVVVRPLLTMTLTVDHRAVDGADAADFLRTLKLLVEDPALAL